MKIVESSQVERIEDPVRSKFSMVVPVLEASARSLKQERIERLGGIGRLMLADLAREFREGSGDAGICFEYAVHEALTNKSRLIHPLASEVLEGFCNITDGADSILFGPEKDGTIPILESTQNALTDDSRVYVGNRGQPPKLKRYIPQIIRAFRRNEERNRLPRAINGLWKADLFIGSGPSERWVGTTVKINAKHLEGAQGLRIGIYPMENAQDRPRHDDTLNLIRLPLPYDAAFMELFYKAFYLVRAFLKADARVPAPIQLPDAEDRFITKELESRRDFPVLEVIEVIREMSQRGLVKTEMIEPAVSASLSEERGLVVGKAPAADAGLVSVAPKAME